MTERENKPQDHHKAEKINARLVPQEKERFEKIRQEVSAKGVSETLIKLMDEHDEQKIASPTLKPSLPEGCSKCACRGVLATNKKGDPIVRCVLKIENKLPQIREYPLNVAIECSQKPTHITIPTKEGYEFQITSLQAQVDREIENTDRLQRKVDIQTQRAENLKIEFSSLEHKVSGMQNALLERDGKIDTLETEARYLRDTIESLSHDSLVVEINKVKTELWETQQLLKVKEDAKDKKIADYTLEIEKLEALRKTEKQTYDEAYPKTIKFLREVEQFLPIEYGTHEIRQKINNLIGYLQTVAQSNLPQRELKEP